MPGCGSLADGDALIDEDGSDGTLAAVDAIDDLLAILDQTATFADWLGGNVRWN